MAIDDIKATDNLNQGRVKLNEAIKQANEVQGQIDELIINSGTSDAETIQARGGLPLLKDRLNASDAQMAQTMQDVEDHGYNLLWNSLLVVDGNWSPALQKALDDSPNKGRTIFIPSKVRFDTTVIFPTITGSTTVLKPVVIKGMSETRVSGALGGHEEGISAIEYTGDGILFDLRLGTQALTTCTPSFINLNIHGLSKVGTIAINGYDVKGANYENILVRKFDIGIKTNDLYYSNIERVRCFYNVSYGMITERYINGTKIHKCSFSNTTTGTGFQAKFAGVAVQFDACWFEANLIAVDSLDTEQVAFKGCYFEANGTTLKVTAHSTSGSTQVDFDDCSINVLPLADYGIRSNGQVNITMGVNRINWQPLASKPFLQAYTSADARPGLPSLISLNNTFTNKPTNLMSHGDVLVNIDATSMYFNKEVTFKDILATNIKATGDFTFKGTNKKIAFNNGDVATTGNLADFNELVTASGILQLFRSTNTTGSLSLTMYAGDGTTANNVKLDAKTGKMLARNGLGVGNSVVGDVTATAKTRKVEVFDYFQNSLGFVQLYQG